jgi:DNA-binding MarR family transcriptional regulator
MSHDLQRSLPYLLARAGIRTGQAFSLEIKQFGLTLNEWRVGATLRQQPHQRLSEVAEHTSIDASTLSRLIDSMVQRKLVIRERSADDARAVALSLTHAGESTIDKVVPLAQLYERVTMAGISPEQVQLLRDMLTQIFNNLDLLEKR